MTFTLQYYTIYHDIHHSCYKHGKKISNQQLNQSYNQFVRCRAEQYNADAMNQS